MKEQKTIQDKELNSVNGGMTPPSNSEICCSNCGKVFYIDSAEKRDAGSGCKKHKEFKCTYCGTWNH